MQEELDEITRRLSRSKGDGRAEQQYYIWATQARIITAGSGTLRRGARPLTEPGEQRHQCLVVLGDPGAGKTTLLRYLALRLAAAVLQDVDRFLAPYNWWETERAWSLSDIGPVRFPFCCVLPAMLKRVTRPEAALRM